MSEMQHELVPKHEKLPQKEVDALLKKHNITIAQLPKILLDDPAIKDLGCKLGDVVKITRNSPVAGTVFYYRGVVHE